MLSVTLTNSNRKYSSSAHPLSSHFPFQVRYRHIIISVTVSWHPGCIWSCQKIDHSSIYIVTTRIDLHFVADVLYPLASHLSFNPIRDKLFQIAITDEVWYYTVIYCGARHFVGLNKSLQSFQDVTMLMDMVLRRLKYTVARARAGEGPPDTILCAIACLITLEVCLTS
jgi:hypothetical protein